MINFLAVLDTLTLQVIAAIVMLITLGAAFVLWHSAPAERYTGRWAIGYGMICLGLIAGALRDHLPSLVSIVMGNASVAMGGALIVNGVTLYCERSRGLWPVAGIGAAVFVLFCLFTYLYPNLHVRVVLMASLFAAVCLRLAWLLWTCTTAGTRLVQRSLAILMALQFCYYAVSITTALIPASATQYADAPAAYNAVYLNAIAIVIILLFGFTGLTTRRLQMRLEHVAHHDALTGALNRRALDLVVQKELSGRATPAPLSVVVFDLDHFKQLNDSFGHQAGDEALQLFADAARKNLRQGDELGRTGGEEFCLILPRTDSATAYRVAERLRTVVEDIRLPSAPEARLTVSAGVATTTAQTLGWSTLLKQADDALYLAKRNGRNRVVTTALQGDER